MRSISPCSCSLGTIGRPAHPHRIPRAPARLLRETTWSSKPVSSVASSECVELSSSMRVARSFRAISSVSRQCGTSRTTATEIKVVNEKLRKAIENEGRVARIEGLLVAVFPDGAQRPGAFGREPPADLARSRRGSGGARPLVAGGWLPVRAVLERSGEGEEGSTRRLLLLEGRTTSAPERAAVGRDGRDPTRVRRSRRRVLDNSLGHPLRNQRADVRCLPARRS